MSVKVTRKRRRGFTIIEVFVAAAVLMAGLAGTFSAFHVVSAGFQAQRDQGVAATLGESWLEQVVVLFPGSPHLTAGGHGPLHYNLDGSYSSTPSYFELRWTVADGDPVPGARHVTVTVGWGTTHSLRLDTFRD